MVSRQEIENDKRFFINSITLDEIIRRCKIKRFELCTINLGSLKHWYKTIKTIYETIPYKFLQNPNDEKNIKEYAEYCNIPSAKKDNPNRSIECYNNLMQKFGNEEYDISKGIIVIDQFNCIQEGLHRSCILYKKFGPKYEIQVLRLITEQKYWGIKKHLKILLFDIKKFFCRNEKCRN